MGLNQVMAYLWWGMAGYWWMLKYLCQGGCFCPCPLVCLLVSWFIWLSAELNKNYSMDFQETWEGWDVWTKIQQFFEITFFNMSFIYIFTNFTENNAKKLYILHVCTHTCKVWCTPTPWYFENWYLWVCVVLRDLVESWESYVFNYNLLLFAIL